jgi:transcriptional regulator
MYLPAHFKEDRVPVLKKAIRKIGFGTLVTNEADGIEANHLPMLIHDAPSPFGTLRGHMARSNPQWQRVKPGTQALAIFLGPHCYVSPSLYPSKEETGKVVPTWNYLAVHAAGEISFYDNPLQLKDHIAELIETHEGPRANSWSLHDAPPDYIDKMLRSIVGFNLVVTRFDGKWKMSQNRSAQDIDGVREGLRKEGGRAQAAVAAAMDEIYRPKDAN